ncbi:hypothetical protein CRG98_019181 [Punica granatum]|uniref:Uncharacterized protein n=1 Tax=Punica granatum TaxID=22663 RepID=A0A2I0JX49_PUNGR|nr:hypothetical protein CRG98_019181 [Punica granatum]
MATSGELQPRRPRCTSLAEVVLVRTSIGDAPLYVACRGYTSTSFNRGCPSIRRLPRLSQCKLQPRMPQCTSLGNAHHGWMMSEVVSLRALNLNAPVLIVDVTRGGQLVQSSPLTVSYRQCQLREYLRAEPLLYQSIREEVREEFSQRREPVHHSSPMAGVSL